MDNNRIRKAYYWELFGLCIVLFLLLYLISTILICTLCIYYPEFAFLNITSLVVCLVVYFNWIYLHLKKIMLARTVLYSKQKVLDYNKQKLNKYKNDINEITDYIKRNESREEELRLCVISLRRMIKEYRIELLYRKNVLKREEADERKNIEYNEIIKKIGDLEKLEDEVIQYSAEGIINRVGRWIKNIFVFHMIKKILKKMKRVFWNRPWKGTFG